MSESANVNVPPVAVVKPRKPRWWLRILLVLVVFVSGMVVGTGLTVIVAVHRIKHRMQHPEEAPQLIAGRLERKLSLNHEQTARIRAILTERQKELMAIRQRVQPEVVGELDKGYEEIGAVLDDKQRPRWAKMYSELKAEWLPPLLQAASQSAATQDK